MKLAVFGPPTLQAATIGLGLGYHYLLGDPLVADSIYAAFARSLCIRGAFVMLSASVNHVRGPYTAEEIKRSLLIAKAGFKAGVDEIILPSVPGQAIISRAASEQVLAIVPPEKCAVCPHGETADEWMDDLMWWVSHHEFSTIVLPAYLEAFPGGRALFIEEIVANGLEKQFNLHLDGIFKHPFAEAMAAYDAFPYIRGISTAAPIAYAQHGYMLSDTVAETLRIDWSAQTPVDMNLLNGNIQAYAVHCSGAWFNPSVAQFVNGSYIW